VLVFPPSHTSYACAVRMFLHDSRHACWISLLLHNEHQKDINTLDRFVIVDVRMAYGFIWIN
jgi:hypothetical protein